MDLMTLFKLIAIIVILSYTIYLFINDIKSFKEKKKYYDTQREVLKKNTRKHIKEVMEHYDK